MDAQLVDRIYECAFVPELWPDVLGELAEIASARTGLLHVRQDAIFRATASSQIVMDTFRSLFETDWVWGTGRVAAYYAAHHSGFLREIDFWKDDSLKEKLDSDPLNQDILVPRGIGWFAGTIFDLPTGDGVIISLEKVRDLGPIEEAAIEQLDALRPHIARSAYMTCRLQLERARVASETLAALGLPALVMDQSGRVLGVNHLMEEMTGVMRWRAMDRIAFKDTTADRMLGEALANTGLTAAGIRSFPAKDVNADLKMVAHVIPIRRAAQDIFSRSAAAVVLSPVSTPGAPPVELVQSLFDLTPAEARVARGLASGKTVEDIASGGEVSISTVRSHVRRVLEKTGCSRQAEAVALLGGISPVRLGVP